MHIYPYTTAAIVRVRFASARDPQAERERAMLYGAMLIATSKYTFSPAERFASPIRAPCRGVFKTDPASE